MTVLTTPFPMGSSVPTDGPGVKSEAFKDALARLAGGLAIITCHDGAAAHGILVSSITGLSLEPPRFLFCVRREASAHDALVKARLCGVSILGADDEDEALTFIDARFRERRLSGPRWRSPPSRPPLLETALTAATCLVDKVIDAGTHSIVIAQAQSLVLTAGEPLVSYNRDLRRLQAAEAAGGW